ncbi:hypothetical protein SIN8267_03514 [Sinobacterium norvegicum]|uniref:Uncharacterized protein n=1 Tax=Sinobacterium norvegicum TaxID=1641715 RepID=A0ABN8ELT4_9GAMM|nr:hypothetical protein [Sinobacterium norvegicum]CAH0993366.1 hypothetical protein SIN8267_03514 [Sinobacterium norvegicum]
MPQSQFSQRLKALQDGEIAIKHDYNEFVGHADVIAQLLEVAPAAIKDDLQALYDLMAEARDAQGMAVLGIFPKLCEPELANVEGRISDYIAETTGQRLDDGQYEAGRLIGESRCPAWPGIGSPLTNNRFPYLLDTSASNYFSTRFWHGDNAPPGFLQVPTGGKVVFKGEYLRCRYFAFHPSDFDTNNLKTIIDEDIVPDDGSQNPFTQVVEEGYNRRFTTQLVFTPEPEMPESNTSYVGIKRNGGFNPAVFLILRTTDSVLGAMPPNSTGVLLPSVTIYDAEGKQVSHYDEIDPYPAGIEPAVETTRFASLPIPDARAINWPARFSTKANWGLPYDILASDDLLYLVSPYSQHLGNVFVVRAKAFSTPHPPKTAVYAECNEARGFTVTTYNFWAGICNDAVVDHQIAHDEDGYYNLVVSTKENRPTNATAEHGYTWVDWGDYLDGQLTFRFLLRQNPRLKALKVAIETGKADADIADFVPRAGHCNKAEFEQQGHQAVEFEMRTLADLDKD